MKVHLDTDFLIFALSMAGPERRKLSSVVDSDSHIEMSSIAWYEFARGPRTPEQLAVARGFLLEDGVIAFTEDLARRTAEVFRSLGSPRRRAADIAIGVTAASTGALLLTRNARDFAGIPDLKIEGPSPKTK
jgi:predicted nucleic acid-binding protein